MPGFLASVKNIEEAKKICELDIDIVDFKKVDDGALGFVGSNTVRQARKLLHNHVISVTMGNDLNPYNESYINNINLTIQNNIEYLKIGLFDISMISEHKKSPVIFFDGHLNNQGHTIMANKLINILQ